MAHGNAVRARRDIRRAMGPAVVQHVTTTEQAIQDLRSRHSGIARQFADDSAGLHAMQSKQAAAIVAGVSAVRDVRQSLDLEHDERTKLTEQFRALRYRGLFGRLRWLLTGR